MVNGVPFPQLTVVGVTMYVAVCGVMVGFTRLPVMSVAPAPLAAPVTPPVTEGVAQV